MNLEKYEIITMGHGHHPPVSRTEIGCEALGQKKRSDTSLQAKAPAHLVDADTFASDEFPFRFRQSFSNFRSFLLREPRSQHLRDSRLNFQPFPGRHCGDIFEDFLGRHCARLWHRRQAVLTSFAFGRNAARPAAGLTTRTPPTPPFTNAPLPPHSVSPSFPFPLRPLSISMP